MAQMVIGLFTDSKKAGEAVGELKQQGFTKDVSVLAYDKNKEEPRAANIKQDISQGAVAGSLTGMVTGALAGLMSGISAIVLPGVGVVVGGPLAALLGVTGGAAGMLAGGVVGALVDLGIPTETALLYEEGIKKGQVLVGVTADEQRLGEARNILNKHGVNNIRLIEKGSREQP